jgi:DNA repair ATPase RecN
MRPIQRFLMSSKNIGRLMTRFVKLYTKRRKGSGNMVEKLEALKKQREVLKKKDEELKKRKEELVRKLKELNEAKAKSNRKVRFLENILVLKQVLGKNDAT